MLPLPLRLLPGQLPLLTPLPHLRCLLSASEGGGGEEGGGGRRKCEREVLWSLLQEVIGSLITHVGSGTSSDIDRALATLGTLVEARLGEVRRFAILIKVGQPGLRWVKVGQAGSSWANLGQAGSSWVELGQAGSSWVKGQVGSSWDA